MKAFVHQGEELKLTQMDLPALQSGEVLLDLKVAGLNRRDLYIPGLRQGAVDPVVLGSDGAGIVSAVGEGVTRVSGGDEVIVNPALNWFEKSAVPPENFEVLGFPSHGTFAEKIIIHEAQLEKKPDHLTWEEAGVLGLASLTGFRAMFSRGQLKAGETVFIPGAGSGVATFLIMFAKSVGARVIVTSRSEEKRQHALQTGADLAIDTSADWSDELENETIDLVIESVGAATFNRSLNALKRGGTIVVFGATTDDVIDFNLREFFYGQYDLLGSTMGSREEFEAMLMFIKDHDIRPIIDQVYPFDEIDQALDRISESTQFGKIGIKISE